jgi:hypothetical protein
VGAETATTATPHNGGPLGGGACPEMPNPVRPVIPGTAGLTGYRYNVAMTDLGRMRVQMVAGIGVVVTVAVGSVLTKDNPSPWVSALGTAPVFLLAFGVAIAMLLTLVRGARRPRLATTGSGYAPKLIVPLPLLITFVAVSTTDFLALGGFGRHIWFMLPLAVTLACVVLRLTWACWRFPMEFFPGGVRIRWMGLRRTIPWDALQPDRPVVTRQNGAVALVVIRPDLVVEQGRPWLGGPGSRQRPLLPALRHPAMASGAIRWYVEHPDLRAAMVGASDVDLLATTWSLESPPPAEATPTPAVGATERPRAPVTRSVRVAVRLTYLAVAIAVVSAAAAIVAAFALRVNLAAADEAYEALHPGLPPSPPGDVTFSLSFGLDDEVRTLAIGALAAAIVIGSVAVGLARFARRGSRAAQVILAFFAGIFGTFNIFPVSLSPLSDLAAQETTGSVLHTWLALHDLEAFVMLLLGVVILFLLISAINSDPTPDSDLAVTSNSVTPPG